MRPTDAIVALVAGFVSFLAPCVLPLVPGYLSAISAVEADRLGDEGSARRVMLASIPFVLGFTVVFVALGIGAQLIGAEFFQTSSCSNGSPDSSSSCSGSPSWGFSPGRSVSSARDSSTGRGAVAHASCSVGRSPSVRRPASGRCWRRSWSSPARRTPWSRARSCLPATRSASRSPSCSPARSSRRRWGRFGGCATTMRRSSSSAARSWSRSASCSSSAASTSSGSTSTASSSGWPRRDPLARGRGRDRPPALLASGHGDDPARGGRSLLPRQAGGASSRPSTRHEGLGRSSRSRYL